MANLSHGFVDLGATNYHAEAIARRALGSDLLPGQLGDGRRADDSPEVKLMRNLVLGAIADVIAAAQPSQVAAVARRRQAAGLVAERWIAGEAGAAITFADACSFGFGIDVATMRKRISALGERPPGAGRARVLAGYSSGRIV